ncbi:MAG: phosphate signaling complex protein PhoU [Caldilineaceae bacterium]|nr:phosphate signaling complex protein PhoU [Caldilineaceae bacterium]
MHPREHFDRELRQLNDSILLMASRVEEQLKVALVAYDRLDPSLDTTVSDLDREVNRVRFEIEEKCIELIATQQPVSRDLRLIVAAMNMIVDIERMGDQAKGIMKAVKHIHPKKLTQRPQEIREMGVRVQEMLLKTKQAYATRDIQLAHDVATSDDIVDKLYAQAFTQIMYRMTGTSTADEAEAEYELLRVAREIERFGDLVTNVAERLIFIVTGSMAEVNIDRDEVTE